MCDNATATNVDRPGLGGVDLIAFFTLVNYDSTYLLCSIHKVCNDYHISHQAMNFFSEFYIRISDG
jgi:hypothetical protein